MAKSHKPSGKAYELAFAKLESSGLSMDDAKVLGIEVIDAPITPTLHKMFKPLCCLKFSYHGPDGEPTSATLGDGPDYYRIRYLEEDKSFAAATKSKPLRYVQEPNTVPAVYFPRNQEGWQDILDDPSAPLIITEGELKSAKACKEGFPTIGLGGVHSWKSARYGLEWLPQLEQIFWVQRNVYICFDSDYRANQNVCTALQEIAEQLERRGAYPHLVNLPTLDGVDKTGLDDFLVHAGPSANDLFVELLRTAEPLGLSRPLWQMSAKYVYVKNPGLVISQETGFKSSPSAFTQHLESTLNYQQRTVRRDGTFGYEAASASAAWLKWPLRTEAEALTYAPGKPKFIDGKQTNFNIWPGWGCEPKEGDVSPFLQLLDHIFTGAEPDAKTWFLRWCACPIQHPGTKLFSSAAIHGVKHGTGKSFIGYTLGKIYGKNFTEINQLDLHNGFNEWAESKQFVMGDDVTGSNKRQDADFLKKLITQKEIRINAKYMPSYVVPDCVNYFFTANHPDSFFLEDDDRRFFIHEVTVGALPEEFYVEYELWLATGGAEAIFDYMLKLDLGDFNPAAPAFKTEAKNRMISNVQSDLAAWVRSLIANPDGVLKIGDIALNKDMYTNKELLELYDPSGKTGTTANGLGRELSRAGIRQAAHGKPIKLNDGSQSRYYIVRNVEKWEKEGHGPTVKHLNDYLVQWSMPKGKKY